MAGIARRAPPKPMNCPSSLLRTAICVLTFGAHPHLARRALNSIRLNCPRDRYELVVGANAVGEETLSLLTARRDAGEIDRLVVSPANLGKSPMMRRMFGEITAEYIWWFDDDSFIREPDAWSRWLQAADSSPGSTVLWGPKAWCGHPLGFTDLEDVARFVRSASWYRGLPPPAWRCGGKGEFNFEGKGTGDGRWFFILGGCFMIRTSAVRALDWPDERLFLLGEDVFLGEAVRQNGWEIGNLGPLGVAVNTEPSRGRRTASVPGEALGLQFGAQRSVPAANQDRSS